MTLVTTPTKPRKAKKDLSSNAKFAITVGTNVAVGLIGIAASVVVTVLLANAATAIENSAE